MGPNVNAEHAKRSDVRRRRAHRDQQVHAAKGEQGFPRPALRALGRASTEARDERAERSLVEDPNGCEEGRILQT